jgi:hypothetical protein
MRFSRGASVAELERVYRADFLRLPGSRLRSQVRRSRALTLSTTRLCRRFGTGARTAAMDRFKRGFGGWSSTRPRSGPLVRPTSGPSSRLRHRNTASATRFRCPLLKGGCGVDEAGVVGLRGEAIGARILATPFRWGREGTARTSSCGRGLAHSCVSFP